MLIKLLNQSEQKNRIVKNSSNGGEGNFAGTFAGHTWRFFFFFNNDISNKKRCRFSKGCFKTPSKSQNIKYPRRLAVQTTPNPFPYLSVNLYWDQVAGKNTCMSWAKLFYTFKEQKWMNCNEIYEIPKNTWSLSQSLVNSNEF